MSNKENCATTLLGESEAKIEKSLKSEGNGDARNEAAEKRSNREDRSVERSERWGTIVAAYTQPTTDRFKVTRWYPPISA